MINYLGMKSVKYVGMNPKIISKANDGSYLVQYQYETFDKQLKTVVDYMILDKQTIKGINQ